MAALTPSVVPYGEWESPITAKFITEVRCVRAGTATCREGATGTATYVRRMPTCTVRSRRRRRHRHHRIHPSLTCWSTMLTAGRSGARLVEHRVGR